MSEAAPGRDLDGLIDDLNSAAARLRAGDLEVHEAAEIVERMAAVAAEIGQALEREASSAGEPPGQETLL